MNKEKNQDILVTAVNERLQKDKTFILAGHFCIFDKSFNVERLPESVFSLMPIAKVVLLESDVTKVCENLRYRDSCCYPLDCIRNNARIKDSPNGLSMLSVSKDSITHVTEYIDNNFNDRRKIR